MLWSESRADCEAVRTAPWGWDISPGVRVDLVKPMAGLGRAVVEQETDTYGVAGMRNYLKLGPGP